MRRTPSFESHLVIREISLLPAGEWVPAFTGWSFIQVAEGTGYWMHAQAAYELPAGSVLVLSPQVKGCIRASQLGKVALRFFALAPERLTGLVSLDEQNFFRKAASLNDLSIQLLPPTDPAAQKFRELCLDENQNDFTARLALLQLFNETFRHQLKQHQARPVRHDNARERLRELLQQTPAAAMLDVTFAELVQKTRCTPRHLSRIFRDEIGMSFRDKQAEIRLTQARELLATTQSKVVDVALESGYQSLSLFNLMFKRRFGVSPGKWREQTRTKRAFRKRTLRVPALRFQATTP